MKVSVAVDPSGPIVTIRVDDGVAVVSIGVHIGISSPSPTTVLIVQSIVFPLSTTVFLVREVGLSSRVLDPLLAPRKAIEAVGKRDIESWILSPGKSDVGRAAANENAPSKMQS